MKKALLLLLLCASVSSALAQQGRFKVWDSENRHSVSLSLGFVPAMPGYYTSQRSSEVDMDYYESGQASLPTISASYFYRLCRGFSVGASLGYGHESTKIAAKEDDKYAFTTRDNVLLFTPTLRVHWLNSKRLEMYSGVGLISYGSSFTTNANRIEGSRERSEGLAIQITPVALAVKLDRTYIFSEVGLGVYGLFRLGAGYRF